MFQSKNKSFTLIEVTVAIFLVTVGVGGIFALIQQSISSISISSSRLVASYLAQEGIEVVRNIRDSNWLEQRTTPATPWDDGLSAGEWEADYQTNDLTQSYTGNFLNIDGNGFYSYFSGESTNFKRKITVSKISDYNLEISVKVEWSERGRNHDVEVIDHLYNWYGYE